MSTHVREESTQALPLTAVAAMLVAIVALWLSAGAGALLLALGLALVLSLRSTTRLKNSSSLVRLLRLALFGIVVALAVLRFRASDSDPIEMIFAWAVGWACACEMTIQAWLQKPLGGARGAVMVFLSGVVLTAASNTFDARFIRFLAPLYMLLLVLSLHEFNDVRRDDKTRGAKRRLSMRQCALALTIALGAIGHWGVWQYRFELNQLGARLLNQAPRPESIGLSTTPTLGATFGQEGSLDRVLRIEGKNVPSHWRALAFDTYDNGRWTPLADKRAFEPFAAPQTTISHGANSFRVERLLDDNGLIFAPLNAQNISPPVDSKLEWARENGGPLRSIDPAPFPYAYDVAADADEDLSAYMSTHVTATQRARCLKVSDSVSPRVRALAQRIGGDLRDSQARVLAVQQYLMSHHAYSLQFNPGAGDPLSDFLLSDKAAHCEYFAASSAILLRCLGVPSRYVIGYYAHESNGENETIVRGRDAHAWAESWIEGRGWVTVDATPGDGRPDKTGEPLPFWQMVRERFQDAVRAARNMIAQVRQSPRKAMSLGFVICLAAIVIAAWIRFKRRRTIQIANFTYCAPDDAELRALAQRFERLMARRGLPCPLYQTWSEHLITPTALSSNGLLQAQQLQLEQLQVKSSQMQLKSTAREAEFIVAYNAARFGGATHSQSNTLRELLRELETGRSDSGIAAGKETL